MRGQSGLTLIELTMVMVISSIVAAFISNLIYYEVNTFDVVVNRKEVGQNSRFALQMMSREIRQISSPDSILDASSDSLGFVDITGQHILYRYNNPRIFRNNDILLDGVVGFDFDYYDEDASQLAQPIADLSTIRNVTLALTTQLRGQSVSSKISVTPRNFY